MTMGTAKRRRWIRAVTPFIFLAAFWAITGVAHYAQQPRLSSAGTLSPAGTGPDGSSVLAGRLAGAGVQVQTVTSSDEALHRANGVDATIVVPTPDYLTPSFFFQVGELAGAHRVVILRPGLRALVVSPVPIFRDGDRWASRAVAPDCRLGAIGSTSGSNSGSGSHNGKVARRAWYGSMNTDGYQTTIDCYHGGVVGVRRANTETVFVGATDPFRNSRIDEADNSALAVDLLSSFGTVIWVDVHKREPLGITVKRPNVDIPRFRRDELDRTSTGNPTVDAFPAAFWAGLILLAGIAVLVAIARARRLGPPVAEPLAVLVPAAEAITGRGRLYHRTRSRSGTLSVLRTAAALRMAQVLDPLTRVSERDLAPTDAGAPPAAHRLVPLIAARTGRSPDQVITILYGPEPTDDETLIAAVAEVDVLVHAVLHQPPGSVPRQGGTP